MICLTCSVPVDENNMCPVCGRQYIEPYVPPPVEVDSDHPIR